MIMYQVSYGKESIDFKLRHKDKKHVTISVLPDMSVEVDAPRHVDMSFIEEKVRKRARWIIRQKNYFQGFLPKQPARQYVSGETHMYRGRQYRLKISNANVNEVKLKGKYFEVATVQKGDPQHVKGQLYDWYKTACSKAFNTITDAFIEKLNKYDIERPVLQIRSMKKRWGSCSPSKNKIILNIELIKAPSHCIEYIIMHELCHLKHPNHDRRFYNFLSKVMPDWKARKERLEKAFL